MNSRRLYIVEFREFNEGSDTWIIDIEPKAFTSYDAARSYCTARFMFEETDKTRFLDEGDTIPYCFRHIGPNFTTEELIIHEVFVDDVDKLESTTVSTEIIYTQHALIEKVRSYAERISEHLMKCVVYSTNDASYVHWVDELAAWIYEINNLKLHEGLQINNDLIVHAIFSIMGDELSDMVLMLELFHRKFVERHPDPYPDFKITRKLYSTLFYVIQNLIWELQRRLRTYGSLKEIQNMLHTILDRFCVNTSWLNV